MKTPVTPASKRRNLLQNSLYMLLGAATVLSLGAWAEWRVQDQKLRELGQNTVKTADEAGGPQGNYLEPTVPITSASVKEQREKFQNAAQIQPNANLGISSYTENRCHTPDILAGLAENAESEKLRTSLNRARAAIRNFGKVGSATGNHSLAVSRQKVCAEIVQTQMAQVEYNLMMSELAAKRQERLQELKENRKSIDHDEAGKLQSNSNAIFALMAQIQIDQQQQKSYNDAYTARLAYLQSTQEHLTQRMLSGDKDDNPSLGTQLLGLASDLAGEQALRRYLEDGRDYY